MKIVKVVVVVVVVVIFKCVPETIMRSLPDINIHSIYSRSLDSDCDRFFTTEHSIKKLDRRAANMPMNSQIRL